MPEMLSSRVQLNDWKETGIVSECGEELIVNPRGQQYWRAINGAVRIDEQYGSPVRRTETRRN
jgi:hypothetical protein